MLKKVNRNTRQHVLLFKYTFRKSYPSDHICSLALSQLTYTGIATSCLWTCFQGIIIHKTSPKLWGPIILLMYYFHHIVNVILMFVCHEKSLCHEYVTRGTKRMKLRSVAYDREARRRTRLSELVAEYLPVLPARAHYTRRSCSRIA